MQSSDASSFRCDGPENWPLKLEPRDGVGNTFDIVLPFPGGGEEHFTHGGQKQWAHIEKGVMWDRTTINLSGNFSLSRLKEIVSLAESIEEPAVVPSAVMSGRAATHESGET